jgi:hypothetical protein
MLNESNKYITKSVVSSIDINASQELVWKNTTNIKSKYFPESLFSKIFNIPRSLKAETISEGEGGIRIVYFNTGKKFTQKITIWKPLEECSFDLYPEKGFTILHFFDISSGWVRLTGGSYQLIKVNNSIIVKLAINYCIRKRYIFFLNFLVIAIIKTFHKNLLDSIKKSSENPVVS